MSSSITPHLNFNGQAREALEFYRDALGGELVLMSYAEMQREAEAQAPDHVIWGQVSTADGLRIMAYDVQADHAYDPGTNAVYISLRGGSIEEVEPRWTALAAGGRIAHPFGPAAWSPAYGMLVDRFGITWIIDVAPASW